MTKKNDSCEFLAELGMHLRNIRISKGWTLEDTESHGWPNWRHLQKIESGKNITILTLLRISKLYSIKLNELFKNIEKKL